MDTRHLVDREIAPIIDLFPRVDLDSAPIAQIRAKAATDAAAKLIADKHDSAADKALVDQAIAGVARG